MKLTDKKGLEVQTLIIVLLAVVFILIMLAVALSLFGKEGLLSGPKSICAKTNWFIKGCKP